MKISKILAASVLAGAVLLSGTACTSSSPSPESDGSSTAAPAPPKKNSRSANEDTTKILQTVNGYYDFITSSDAKDKVRSAGSGLMGKQATDEDLQTLVDEFPDGFKYFDTSSSQLIKNAYTVMSVSSMSLADQGSIKISAPEESVNIDGDTATLNTTWISVTKNGKTLKTTPESAPDFSDLVKLVKKDDGSWVIVANSSMPKPTVP